MKKVLSLVLSLALACGVLVGLTACSGEEKGDVVKPYNGIKTIAYSDMKVGLITLHDEKSTYDLNFINAFKAACEAKGVKSVITRNIPETNKAYEAAADLVDQGCNLIFADSFGHEPFILKAAKEFPDVQFCHSTGVKAHGEKRGNFHDAFANIYEGRFLAGVAGGEKIKELVAADANKVTTENGEKFVKIGYVGAYTYAEVVSGYTSFYLGVKYALKGQDYGVKMEVSFTGSWYDETAEKETANTLITNGAILVSQHADSMGAPTACEKAGVPNVSYNGSTEASCPNTFIVSSRINWQPYYEYAMECLNSGTEIAYDWTAGMNDTPFAGSVCLTDFGAAAASTTATAVSTAFAALKAGTLKVFDVSTFTVDGKAVSEHVVEGTNVIKTVNGITYFDESSLYSAPCFDLKIDGIKLLNTKY